MTNNTSNHLNFDALESLNLKNLKEVKVFLEANKITENDLVEILGVMAHTETQNKAVTDLVEALRVDKIKGMVLYSSPLVVALVAILFAYGLSGTNTTQEIQNDATVEETKSDNNNTVEDNTYKLEAKDIKKVEDNTTVQNIENINTDKKTKTNESSDEINLDAMDIDANDLVVVKTALENAEEAKKQTEEAKKQTEEAKKQTEEAKKQTEEAKKQTEKLERNLEEEKKKTEEEKKKTEELKFAFGKGNK